MKRLQRAHDIRVRKAPEKNGADSPIKKPPKPPKKPFKELYTPKNPKHGLKSISGPYKAFVCIQSFIIVAFVSYLSRSWHYVVLSILLVLPFAISGFGLSFHEEYEDVDDYEDDYL